MAREEAPRKSRKPSTPPARLPADIAHALRSKLTELPLALRLLEVGDQEERARAVAIVRGATQQLSELIDRFSGTVRPNRTNKTNQPLRAGTRVLVVEDEYLLAQTVADLLSRAGCEVVGPVGTVEGALGLLPEHDVDYAVVDANLDGEFSSALVEALAQKGAPAMILSGYDQAALPNSLKSVPFLQKPVDDSELLSVLAGLGR